MSIQELIEKHVGGEDKAFNEKFSALATKEALCTITPDEMLELDDMSRADRPQPKEMDSDNLKQFAIELMEMVNTEANSLGNALTVKAWNPHKACIDKALEELRK